MKKSILFIVLSIFIFQATINNEQIFAQTDGTLDNTFGTGGKVLTPIGSQDAASKAVALQADGKIVVAGWSYNSGIYDEIAVVRYNSNGTIDNTFGTAGIAIGNPGIYSDAYAIKVQSDGKILIAGVTENGADNDFILIRFNTDGTPDNTFGTSGITTTDFGSTDDKAFAIALQSNGKIVLAGQTFDGTNFKIAMARYNTDGTLDNTYGSSGKIVESLSTADDLATALALQPDGKIVVTGYTWNGTNSDIALLRYATDGTLDNTFGTGGVTKLDISSSDNYGYALALQTDGKIVVTGTTAAGTGDYSVSRFNANGTVDNTFGTNGSVITDFNGLNDESYAVIIQTNGKIVAAGFSLIPGGNNDFSLARYNSNGTLDTLFGTSGKVITPVGTNDDWAYSMLLQPDGKIVVAGYSINGSGDDDIAVVRYFISPTGITDINSEGNDVNLYPNPANNYISINAGAQTKENIVSIFNVQGQLVFSQPLLNTPATLDITTLAKGVYTIKISNTERTIIKKFVKE